MKAPDATLAGTPHKNLWFQLLALRWPVALACAAVLPLALPLPGNPITLAGFVAFVGGAALVSSVQWLIMFLPALAAIGPHFLELDIAGINLFGFRLLIIILAVFSTPLTSRSDWWFNPVARYAVLFMILWAVYGLLSLLWTPDQASGVTEILTILFGLGLILALFNLKYYTPERLDMLRFGWVFALIVVLSQAVWELLTGERLPSHKDEDYFVGGDVLSSTLGAPELFAAFLLLATPFLLWSMTQARGQAKLLYIGLLAATYFFTFYGGVRNSFIALNLELVTYFLILESRWYVRWVTVACGLVAAALLANVLMHSHFMLAEKFQKASEEGLEEGSIDLRITFSINGIWMALETGGRGVGAGGFEQSLASRDLLIQLPLKRRGIPKNAHNVWVEILSQYGFVPFVGLMALFGWLARLGWQARRLPVRGPGVDRGVVARVVLVGLVGFAFYGVQGGSVLLSSVTWMFLASLCVLGAFLRDQRPIRNRVAAPPSSLAPSRASLRRTSDQSRGPRVRASS